jgi:Glycine/D-amino acid oxidases (deaminating)
MMLSIWEKNSLLRYDIIIIGSGIVGLCTAYYLKQKYPNKHIAIFERGLLPSGASTRNAGFSCLGSPTELLADIEQVGENEMLSLFELRLKGLNRLKTLLTDDELGYETNGSYELLFDKDKESVEQLEYLNALLRPILHCDAFKLVNEQIACLGFEKIHALVENTCEGALDTGKMMFHLIQKVISLGVEIKTGTEVVDIQEANHEVTLVCKNNLSNQTISFYCDQLAICNNAFVNTLIPTLDVVPGRGQVMLTKPIPNLKFKGIFHFDRGYYYFREYKGCVLFGGGRNQDIQGETTHQFSINEKIQHDLIEKLQEIILPNQSFQVDMRWSGIMAFGKHKRPILERHSNRIYLGVRMGGMGVAIGSEVAYSLCEMMYQ